MSSIRLTPASLKLGLDDIRIAAIEALKVESSAWARWRRPVLHSHWALVVAGFAALWVGSLGTGVGILAATAASANRVARIAASHRVLITAGRDTHLVVETRNRLFAEAVSGLISAQREASDGRRTYIIDRDAGRILTDDA